MPSKHRPSSFTTEGDKSPLSPEYQTMCPRQENSPLQNDSHDTSNSEQHATSVPHQVRCSTFLVARLKGAGVGGTAPLGGRGAGSDGVLLRFSRSVLALIGSLGGGIGVGGGLGGGGAGGGAGGTAGGGQGGLLAVDEDLVLGREGARVAGAVVVAAG